MRHIAGFIATFTMALVALLGAFVLMTRGGGDLCQAGGAQPTPTATTTAAYEPGYYPSHSDYPAHAADNPCSPAKTSTSDTAKM